MRKFTCEAECEKLTHNMEGAVRLPANVTCEAQGETAKGTAP